MPGETGLKPEGLPSFTTPLAICQSGHMVGDGLASCRPDNALETPPAGNGVHLEHHHPAVGSRQQVHASQRCAHRPDCPPGQVGPAIRQLERFGMPSQGEVGSPLAGSRPPPDRERSVSDHEHPDIPAGVGDELLKVEHAPGPGRRLLRHLRRRLLRRGDADEPAAAGAE